MRPTKHHEKDNRWDDENLWKLIESARCCESKFSLPAPMFTVVKMSKSLKKWPTKYLLNVTVHGFSKALKLGEYTFVMIFFRILLNFVQNIVLLSLHGGLMESLIIPCTAATKRANYIKYSIHLWCKTKRNINFIVKTGWYFCFHWKK